MAQWDSIRYTKDILGAPLRGKKGSLLGEEGILVCIKILIVRVGAFGVTICQLQLINQSGQQIQSWSDVSN